jgi:hypothetical protein
MPSHTKNMKCSSSPADTPPISPLLEASHQATGHQYALELIGMLEEPTTTAKQVLPMEDIQQLMDLLKVAEKKGSLSADISFKEVDEMYDLLQVYGD